MLRWLRRRMVGEVEPVDRSIEERIKERDEELRDVLAKRLEEESEQTEGEKAEVYKATAERVRYGRDTVLLVAMGLIPKGGEEE